MPLIKRKPVLYAPLPSLSTVLQPLGSLPGPSTSINPGDNTAHALSSPAPTPAPAPAGKKKAAAVKAGTPAPSDSGAGLAGQGVDELAPWVAPDASNDEEQLDRLMALFEGRLIVGGHEVGRGKKAGTTVVSGRLDTGARPAAEQGGMELLKAEGGDVKSEVGTGQGEGQDVKVEEVQTLHQLSTAVEAVGIAAESERKPDVPPDGDQQWKIWDRDVWYIESTGEIFMDYDSYCNRLAFYQQPSFQCEVSGKSSLSYFSALGSEQKEARQLHTRFPRQLKKAVLSAVQFQIEGKLETLADRIYERFVNRFFDEEKIFVDVQGDKYLARIVRTFPPKDLVPPPSTSALGAVSSVQPYHPYASDLNMSNEEVLERDDPGRYFYNVRLIEEGVDEGTVLKYENGGSSSASASGSVGGGAGGAGGGGEGAGKWEGSVMEVQADKLSRDRINFSRAMLKRFIRDCVLRDAAVYSPWLVKTSVALRYGLPTSMSPEVQARIAAYREDKMDRRKREREERLGLGGAGAGEDAELEMADDVGEGTGGAGGGAGKKKRARKDDGAGVKEEERAREEEERRRKKALKFPAEDLLVEWQEEKDTPAGRIPVRPSPAKTLPFGAKFESFLMSWSFLNVMGKPLGLSPFTLDDYEQALYHNDPWTSPTTIMVEIHAVLINAIIRDLQAGNPAVAPLAQTGMIPGDIDNETDYWEGAKGATTELLRPIVLPMAETWRSTDLKARDNRKGWEMALVGCLWEKATLESLPHYLDNILHLTFEDKPAPTRPTWSTGPASTAAFGLIPTKPEKRYSTLHHLHKLDIISWLIELVAQTAAVREFMEESTVSLTETRKDQVEAKREWKRVLAELQTLEPKAEPGTEGGEGAEGTAAAVNGNGDGEADISMATLEVRAPSPGASTVNDVPNGTVAFGSVAERDELDDASMPSGSRASSPLPPLDDDDIDSGVPRTGASRRKAMNERAAQRSAEEAVRSAQRAREVADARVKKNETKALASAKTRLIDEEAGLRRRMRALEFDFRSHLYTLRARPVGADRYGNKVWWLDGLGSAPLFGEGGKVQLGTGRVYLQGPEEWEEEWVRQGSTQGEDHGPPDEAEVESRRVKEEGQGRLGRGEWGMYEDAETFSQFLSYLNPRGLRESQLLKQLRKWSPEIEAGMRKRRSLLGLDGEGDGEADEAAAQRRARPVRRVAGAGGGGRGGEEDEGRGYQAWRNRRAEKSG